MYKAQCINIHICTYECVFLVNNGSHRTGFPATSVHGRTIMIVKKKITPIIKVITKPTYYIITILLYARRPRNVTYDDDDV